MGTKGHLSISIALASIHPSLGQFLTSCPKDDLLPKAIWSNYVLLFLKRPEIHLYVWYRNSAKKWKMICQNVSSIFLEWYKLKKLLTYSLLLAYAYLNFLSFWK